MSLTTLDDLLVAAEREMTDLAQHADLNRRRVLDAWPVFLGNAAHAIVAAGGARPARWYAIDALVAEAGRPNPARTTASTRPDPAMRRAGQLLGAAGDLLASAPRTMVADPILDEATIAAAQSRVAGLLAAGAHLVTAAVGEAQTAGQHVGQLDLRAGEQAALVETLALSAVRAHPATHSPADDIAVVAVRDGRAGLEEIVELWARQARDTLQTRHPAARDLQGLAGDLAQLCAHSRLIVRVAADTGLLPASEGRALDAALGKATIQWLDATRAWDNLHTTQPPDPTKIATSHTLAAALQAVTRDGKDWATTAAVAERIDLKRGLWVVRRGQDVAAHVATAMPDLGVNLVDAGMLFVPPRAAVPALVSIDATRRNVLAPADRPHIEGIQALRP